jgi:hypothetical protein
VHCTFRNVEAGVASSAAPCDTVLRVFLLITLVHVVAACVGCSDSQIVPHGNFTNADLKGNYVYSMAGTRFGQATGNGLYQEAGVFTADGDGHITNGSDDFVQGALVSNPLSGSYKIAADGTGTISLSIGSQQFQWVVTLASPLQAYLVEFDANGCGGGAARLQAGNIPSTVLAGSYAFRVHNIATSGSVAKVGSMTVNPDGSLIGDEDVLRGGTLLSPNITGTMAAANASGRGLLTIQENTGVISDFIYYVVDSNTVNFLQTDAGSLGEGRAELRGAGPFADSSLRASFVFRSVGDTPANIGGANTVGSLTADGNGLITAGSIDAMKDGNAVAANLALTGTYSVDANGRVSITLTPAGASSILEIGRLVDPTHGFFLVNSSDRVEDGRFDQQQATSFSAASVTGQFGFYMSGYDSQTPPLVSRLGVFSFDGQQDLTFENYYVNREGLLNQKGGLSGTYTVSSNGRVAASVPGVTKTLVFYLISANSGYILVGDTGAEEPGRFEQPQP